MYIVLSVHTNYIKLYNNKVTLTHILIVDNENPGPKYLLVLNSYFYSYANQGWTFNTQRV